ncbi:MAG TPA: GatB/YqeY domain-containing protein [Anaerolineaceae bacterium]|nr:GatB/YqeY domain-containing protein [Anaerolineaceae bacterium]
MDNNQKLKADLQKAIKDQDPLRKRVLRLLISTIQLAEVAKGSALSDSEFVAVVQKEIKTKLDTIADAEKAGRADMVSESRLEIKELEAYLPRQLTEAELVALAEEIIRETGAASPKDMGLVLKVLIPRLAGRASNQDASRVVKDCLSKPA